MSLRPKTTLWCCCFSGKPLNEPIYGMGPFVMSNHEDLVKAFRDFGNGKFGEM